MTFLPVPAAPSGPLFICPCCGQFTTHPQDVAETYCPLCHWQTGDPELGSWHMSQPCRWRNHPAPHALTLPGL